MWRTDRSILAEVISTKDKLHKDLNSEKRDFGFLVSLQSHELASCFCLGHLQYILISSECTQYVSSVILKSTSDTSSERSMYIVRLVVAKVYQIIIQAKESREAYSRCLGIHMKHHYPRG